MDYIYIIACFMSLVFWSECQLRLPQFLLLAIHLLKAGFRKLAACDFLSSCNTWCDRLLQTCKHWIFSVPPASQPSEVTDQTPSKRSTPALSMVKHWTFWFRKHCDLFLLYLTISSSFLSSSDPFITQTGCGFLTRAQRHWSSVSGRGGR